MEEIEHGVRKSCRNITNFRHADDTTLLSETEEGLGTLLSRLKKESEKSSLLLNAKKTKIMVRLGGLEEFTTVKETYEVVDNFNFLGTKIDRDGGCTSEIARKIAMGNVAMNGLYRVMKDRTVLILMKVRLVKALAFPVMMCGCKSWVVNKSERKKLVLLKKLRITWTERRKNRSILDKIKPETSLEGMVVKRALAFFRRTMRTCRVEKDVILGKVEETRRRGR